MLKSESMSTLVIGGGGYIGTHLLPMLIAKGRKVTVLGRSSIPSYKLPQEALYISGDFSNHNLICQLLDKHQEVIHLAYATVPNTSFKDPLADLLQNLPPSVQLFSEAANRNVKLILVSSGGTVYGDALELPITERHTTKPISPYGVTKLTLENYANLYAATHGLKFVCVRPANAYGIGQRPFVGQGFVSTAIASALGGMPIKIFGKSGTMRDYIYVSDLASGICSVLIQGRLYETYNISSGIGLSNIDVINTFNSFLLKMNLPVQIENLPERSFDVKVNILDSSKLQLETGWKPRIEFVEGISLTFDWLRNLQMNNHEYFKYLK